LLRFPGFSIPSLAFWVLFCSCFEFTLSFRASYEQSYLQRCFVLRFHSSWLFFFAALSVSFDPVIHSTFISSCERVGRYHLHSSAFPCALWIPLFLVVLRVWTVSCFTYCPLDTVPLSAHSVLSIPSSGVHFTLSSPCHFLFTASGFPFCLRFCFEDSPCFPLHFQFTSRLLSLPLFTLALTFFKHFLERERCKPLSTSCHFIPSVVIVLERECG